MSIREHAGGDLDRDLALMALLAAVLSALVAAAAALMAAAAVTTGLLGGGWAMPAPRTWLRGLVDTVADPARPCSGLGAPWTPALAAHPLAYWMVAGVLLAAGAALTGLTGLLGWRRFGPTRPGHATRGEIRQMLSLEAARDSARITRPDLTPAGRRGAPLEQVAVPMHHGPGGMALCTPLENPTGTLAPTQTGKSRRDLVHKVLAAPGALLCSSTKPDLLNHTALARALRPGAGPVLVFDATGTCRWPARLRWSPLHGCTDPDTAYERAHTMVEAAAVGMQTGVGNDKVFRDRAKRVLQAYFLAAARNQRTIADVVTWAVAARPPELEPVTLLAQDPGGAQFTDFARNLAAEIGMVAETSDAVWMSVRRVIEPFLSTRIRALCTPPPGHEFDAAAFIAARGSLYLIAGEHQSVSVAPILTALVQHWLTAAQALAPTQRWDRLTPPATAILDELTNATPVPQLPEIISDSAGRGVLIHWAAQSWPALQHTYTPIRARELTANTTTLTFWGGITDKETLEWISTLTGHHDRARYQTHSTGWLTPATSSMGTETVPTYRPGEIRNLPRNHVLLIHRNLRSVLARTRDVTDRPDWPTLAEHLNILRTGHIPITPDGRPQTVHTPDHIWIPTR